MDGTGRTITIPATIEEAKAQLGGLERLLTAKGWERAAIVYAFTRDGVGGRPSAAKPLETERLTINGFAALGIHGLSAWEAVHGHRANWQWAIQEGIAIDVGPGDAVILPDPTIHKYPPTSELSPKNKGVTADATPEEAMVSYRSLAARPEVFEQIKADLIDKVKADPVLAIETHQAAMTNPDAAPRIENAFVQRAAEDTRLAGRVQSAWEEFHPRPDPVERPASTLDVAAFSAFGAAICADIDHRARKDLPAILGFIGANAPLAPTSAVLIDKIVTDLERARRMLAGYEDQIRAALDPEGEARMARLIDSIGR